MSFHEIKTEGTGGTLPAQQNYVEAPISKETPPLTEISTKTSENLTKLESQNNTLGSIASGLKTAGLVTGILLKGFGKGVEAAAMGAALVPAGLVGMAGAGVAYGASLVLGQDHAKAMKNAKAGAQIGSIPTAFAASVLLLPVSIGAFTVKSLGKLLIKSAGEDKMPESLDKLDKSFASHLLPAIGKIGKNASAPLMEKAINKAFNPKVAPQAAPQSQTEDEVPDETASETSLSEVSEKAADHGEKLENLKENMGEIHKNLSNTNRENLQIIFGNQNHIILNQNKDTLQIQDKDGNISIKFDQRDGKILINGKKAEEYQGKELQRANDLLEFIKIKLLNTDARSSLIHGNTETIENHYKLLKDGLASEAKTTQTEPPPEKAKATEVKIPLTKQEKERFIQDFSYRMHQLSEQYQPGRHSIVEGTLTRFYLEKTGNGKTFHIQDHAEALKEGSGLSIALNLKNNSLLINGKPAESYDDEKVLEKAKDLFDKINNSNGSQASIDQVQAALDALNEELL